MLVEIFMKQKCMMEGLHLVMHKLLKTLYDHISMNLHVSTLYNASQQIHIIFIMIVIIIYKLCYPRNLDYVRK